MSHGAGYAHETVTRPIAPCMPGHRDLRRCAMCDNSFDDTYNAYGGAVPRHDLRNGRVGSILSDPGFQNLGPDSADTHSTEADLYHSESVRDAPAKS